MDRKDFLIAQAQWHMRRHDANMDYRSKVLREQALAFIARYSNSSQLALVVAQSLKQ